MSLENQISLETILHGPRILKQIRHQVSHNYANNQSSNYQCRYCKICIDKLSTKVMSWISGSYKYCLCMAPYLKRRQTPS